MVKQFMSLHQKTSSIRPYAHETHSVASKSKLACPRVFGKVYTRSKALHRHQHWWLQKDNVLEGQPLHPLQHAHQFFTDTSNQGWGAHLGDFTARGLWSVLESKLHINFLELKAVILTLKCFEHLCRDQTVLIATDNTTVVAYMNKEEGMKSGSLCALLWRLLST